MKTHTLTTMVLLAFGLLLPLTASAQKGGLRIKALEKAAVELGISDDTLGQIKDIMYDGRRGSVDLRANLERARIDLHELMDQEDPNRSEVMAAIERVGTLQIKMKQHRAGILLSVRALLTPEQRRGLRPLMKKWRQRRGKKQRRKGLRKRGGPDDF